MKRRLLLQRPYFQLQWGNVFADKPWSGGLPILHGEKKMISIKARKVALNFSLDEEGPLPINWLERERKSTLDGSIHGRSSVESDFDHSTPENEILPLDHHGLGIPYRTRFKHR
ncbi:hypothetical protein AVEN_187020-1 [Araneus ventricosus]|uniref:Uncharacterized protein n=1 Tax=Araneus ventricosus TaxID=182803 RepID=A0A4Y2VSM2_ARAVE|nr:hypothetical protein AVEN_187020-1 [Araneus ventricosus]